MQVDLYQSITDRIVAMLEQGVAPWRSPILGRQSAGFPKNLESGKAYRGVNVFFLAFTAWAKGYASSYWLTFRQCQARGGAIRKGEKSSVIVFWKQYEIIDEQTGEEKEIPVLRYFNVFNAEQCHGIAVPDDPKFEPVEFQPVEAAARIVTGYADPPQIEHGGQQAYYRAASDAVRLPEVTRFCSSEQYYGTLFHELAHSTGHSKRLNRGLDTDLQPFGSPDYGREELLAEMAASFLAGDAGIEPATIENSAAYLQGWIQRLRGDSRLAIQAAGAAQKAADWIRGRRE